MAYTVPTATELKAAFPAFAAVDDAAIDFWVARAGRIVDTSWTEGDYAFAQMLLAAHYMTTNGLGSGAEAQAAAAGAAGYKTMRSGALTLERFDNANDGAGEYGSTQYGRQFYALLRANKGGPRITRTGTVSCVYPYPQGEA